MLPSRSLSTATTPAGTPPFGSPSLFSTTPEPPLETDTSDSFAQNLAHNLNLSGESSNNSNPLPSLSMSEQGSGTLKPNQKPESTKSVKEPAASGSKTINIHFTCSGKTREQKDQDADPLTRDGEGTTQGDEHSEDITMKDDSKKSTTGEDDLTDFDKL
ncbi:hypothetical protein P691DRAFT_765991 [Macrolepiota fuliginosa MF-IS2]|uniref:Uncharacterized protein n=1 Tax=Macrolepiota fuliginosa MF-IS2 TaxID=1400762 RepID=A0A9P6BXP8_9AGAR|nr:hypothetical protein P691DRAFT_765991 [Macrolepiota fuliginosa MF-IS2]